MGRRLSPSPVHRAAYKTGNAAGAHRLTKKQLLDKIERMRVREEMEFLYEEELIEDTTDGYEER